MKELISIIVPVYNVEKYINKCIDSIINQTYKNLEIILVDDGSTDSSGKICDDYAIKDNRIKVVHKKNGGVSSARNEGIRVANGKYIGFIDSDDWICNKMYEKLYNIAKKNDSEIVECNFIRLKKEEKIKSKTANVINYTKKEYLKKFFKINSQECEYYPWNKLYNAKLLTENQYPIGIRQGEDAVGTYKSIINASRITKTTEVLYYYRMNPESVTENFSIADSDLIKVWDIIINIAKENSPEDLKYAILNRKRTNFTLLYRMARNYSIEDLKKNEYANQLLLQLKEDEKYLLKSPIVFSRKILIFLFCRNYFFFSKFLYSKKV